MAIQNVSLFRFAWTVTHFSKQFPQRLNGQNVRLTMTIWSRFPFVHHNWGVQHRPQVTTILSRFDP
jgi:hypothetical protein